MDDGRRVHPEVARLLGRLRGNLVVIGSVARGGKRPADLDIWVNCDGSVGGERRHDRVRRLVRESGLPFESAFPASWTFRLGDVQVELIGNPNVGASFAAVRRAARVREVFGLDLPVARPDHAGTPSKGRGED